MVKCKMWLQLVPQVMKEAVNTLVNCRATFECNMEKHSLYIYDVTRFTFDSENSTPMYRIEIETENNTKSIYLALGNIEAFSMHFVIS